MKGEIAVILLPHLNTFSPAHYHAVITALAIWTFYLLYISFPSANNECSVFDSGEQQLV